MSKTATKKSSADKFSSLFDQDWSNTKSRIRTRFDDGRVYDVTNSWDAKSDNPQEFSRLEQTLVPHQRTCPIVLSGAAVVQLEETAGYNAINVKHPTHALSAQIPLTREQADIGMTPDLTANIPFVQRARSQGKQILIEKNVRFENMMVQAPTFREIEVSRIMEAAGPECDQKLLNPKQRREIYDTTGRMKVAKEIILHAQMDRSKTKKQLAGPQYHRGVLMVDSSDNIHSEIYGNKAKEQLAEQEYKRQIHLERRSNLANKTSSMAITGNILVPDTIGPRVKLNRDYQAKGGNFHSLSFDETHNRIFCQIQGPASSERTQLLRDIELSGKDYNITQHTMIEHWPARRFERQVERDMAHPSQQALEGSRNLQGSLRF